MRRSILAAGLAMTALCTVAAPAHAAPSPSELVARCTHIATPGGASQAAIMLAEINCARKASGLPTVRGFKPIGGVASRWSAHLSQTQRLEHNPQRSQQVLAVDHRWTLLSEIVGGTQTGPGVVDRIVTDWFQSSVHRHVILNPRLRIIGIGLKPGFGWVWATCDFVDQ